MVSAGKHIWNRGWWEEVLHANIEVKIFPEVNHARKIQQQTLSEPLFPESYRVVGMHTIQIQNISGV